MDEIERRGLSILAIIPSIGSAEKKQRKKGYKSNVSKSEKIERRLLTHEDPKSPISEAYRSLRTSLMIDGAKKIENPKIILVSSPGPGEGKTTSVANLAITYANMGKKTLLIDADLRKPVLHKMFPNPSICGLTSFLSGEINQVDDIVYSSDVENLSIVKCGVSPPNPSELLASKAMGEFIEQAKNNF